VRLSVNVVSSEGILVDNNYGRLEIDSDPEVTGTPAQPVLAGRLTIGEGGAVFLAGQSWSIERGTVDFTSATRIEPDFDLAFVTRVQQYDVRLSVRGTPDALEATLTAPDGLGQADAVSLLLTGRQANDATAAQLDIARGQMVMLLSGQLLPPPR
jgi:autotransporter translocation and assembly factor TamB